MSSSSGNPSRPPAPLSFPHRFPQFNMMEQPATSSSFSTPIRPTQGLPFLNFNPGMMPMNPPFLPGQQQLPANPPPKSKGNATPAPDPSIPPNQTIYINNLNDSVKTDELKKNLRSMFKQFGEIKDIIAMKSFWRRGQAWIVFKNVASATKALHGMQGFVYHGQNMRINYALTKSDCIAKEDGTLEFRPSGPKKPRAIREREQKQEAIFQALQQQYLQQLQSVEAVAASNATAAAKREATPLPTNMANPKPSLAQAGASGRMDGKTMDKNSLLAAVQARAAETLRDVNRRREMDSSLTGQLQNFNMFSLPGHSAISTDLTPAFPNKMLFVENLPEDATETAVASLFRLQHGYVEARVILARRIAFVDFETDRDAGAAMNAMQDQTLNGCRLKMSYAKR